MPPVRAVPGRVVVRALEKEKAAGSEDPRQAVDAVGNRPTGLRQRCDTRPLVAPIRSATCC
jgi:hypothetical protein